MAKQDPRPVNGKVVAITGGARGIGRSTAEALVREGAKVAIGDLDAELAEQVAGEIGGGTVGLPLDVTERESFAAFLDGVEERLGPVDVLINNAGIMPLGDFAEEDDATTIRIIDINVHGVLTGTKLARPSHASTPHRPHHQRGLDGREDLPARRRHVRGQQACRRRPHRVGSAGERRLRDRTSRSSCRSSCAPSSARGSRRPAG